ncbi:MAG: VWA domain-containing protein [Candidatus Poribacteria bacterium]|nr:VWA domain-containing protein [Candidatus Poribacteria bacterium]
MLPLNIYSTYSDKFQYSRYHRRRKTRRAFLFSLVLHAIAIGIIGLGYIQWYRPMQPSEPLTSEAIAVTSLQRFHVSSTHKRSMPAKRRSTPTRSKTSPALNQNVAKLVRSAPSMASNASIPMLRTDARLPMAETSLREQTTETLAWKTIATTQAQAPTIAPKPKTVQGEAATNRVTDNKGPAQPIDRDARMGEALAGIAESVADSKIETAVDLVFLLDISGSMIDNIRAVGRQLNRMVTVFEEKGVDFTLGIVIFRYLEGDTIIHPQTRDSEKYKRLLTSHVVAAAGDERAHNAIIKTIRRVNFREGVNRRFILVTDEPSKGSYTLPEVLAQCFQNNITIDVIGINHTTHRALTTKTGGLWFPIPIQQ